MDQPPRHSSDHVQLPPVNFQTARLARGRHRSSANGVSVVELASMIAEEAFGHRPRSVCPVIAAYMQVVNDTMAEHRLRELLPVAPTLVGTRGGRRRRRERARTCARWAAEMEGGAARRPAALRLSRWNAREAGSACALAAMNRGGPDLALALIELLLDEDQALERAAAGAPAGRSSPVRPIRPGR